MYFMITHDISGNSFGCYFFGFVSANEHVYLAKLANLIAKANVYNSGIDT